MPRRNAEELLNDVDRLLDALDRRDGADVGDTGDRATGEEGAWAWRTAPGEVTYGPLAENASQLPPPVDARVGEGTQTVAGDARRTGLLAPGSGLVPSPEELPDLTPAGYRRDGRGSWRRLDGTKVPGGRDLTLRRLYGDPSGGVMRLPAGLVRHRPELGWAGAWAVPGGAVVEVPAAAWELMADHCLGVDAPELNVVVMVDVAELAQVAGGLSAATLRSHLARATAPPPLRRRGSLWPPMVAGWWAVRRAAPGRPPLPADRRAS